MRGKGAMDGAGRGRRRPGTLRQDAEGWRAIPLSSKKISPKANNFIHGSQVSGASRQKAPLPPLPGFIAGWYFSASPIT